jgi:hypothetical protein
MFGFRPETNCVAAEIHTRLYVQHRLDHSVVPGFLRGDPGSIPGSMEFVLGKVALSDYRCRGPGFDSRALQKKK